MGAASTTGTGQGAVDRNSPPSIKNDRLLGPFGPRILLAGQATMSGGEVTVNHEELETEDVIRIPISNSAYPVFLYSFNNSFFVVKSLEVGSSFSFYWIIVALN